MKFDIDHVPRCTRLSLCFSLGFKMSYMNLLHGRREGLGPRRIPLNCHIPSYTRGHLRRRRQVIILKYASTLTCIYILYLHVLDQMPPSNKCRVNHINNIYMHMHMLYHQWKATLKTPPRPSFAHVITTRRYRHAAVLVYMITIMYHKYVLGMDIVCTTILQWYMRTFQTDTRNIVQCALYH